MSPSQIIGLSIAAGAAGAINALAGGGMLVAYPALVALGLSPIAANATATVALLPGSIGAQVGYRSHMRGAESLARILIGPCIAGGIIGAVLLLRTPPARFAALVPWLVLVATLLFAVQGPVTRFAVRGRSQPDGPQPPMADRSVPGAGLMMVQLVISVYIGYFGAGAGALMLAAFGFMGLSNIHQMNGLKLWSGMCTNATAALLFALRPALVHWSLVLVMTLGSIAGGYVTSRVAQRVSQRAVRVSIIGIGVASAVWLAVAR